MSRYCNDYYEKFPEAIKLKCEYDLDYVIKYVSCKKNQQLQLQVSNICHVNNIFRTRCLSPMYPANNETKICLRYMPVICRHCRQRISVKNMPQNC